MLYVLFIPIIPYMKLYVMCTDKWFLAVSRQAICYVWTQTPTTWVLMHTDIYFKCQDFKGWTLNGPTPLKQRKKRWKLSPTFWKWVGVQEVRSSGALDGVSIFCWSFLSKNPLSLKVASQLLNCTVTFSSRKYSESYQMLLGAQRGTSLSSSVMVQLFPHGGILANLSILRTRKNV